MNPQDTYHALQNQKLVNIIQAETPQAKAERLAWQMSPEAREEKTLQRCSACGREAMFWGGDTCDVCDSDSNSMIDQREGVGVGPSPESKSLFAPEEKGFSVIGGALMTRIPRGDPRNEEISKSIRIAQMALNGNAAYWQQYTTRFRNGR